MGVADTEKEAWTRETEGEVEVTLCDRMAFGVSELHFDEGKVLTVGLQDRLVGKELQAGRSTCRLERLRGRYRPVGEKSLGSKGARLIGQRESGLEARLTGTGLFANQPIIEVKTYPWEARIEFYVNGFALPTGPVPRLGGGPGGPTGADDAIDIEIRFAHADGETGNGVPKRLAVVGDRFAQTREVDVTAIGTVPGPLVSLPVFAAAARVGSIMGTTDTRFAEVVDGRPDEVADDVGEVGSGCPTLESGVGVTLGLPDDAFGTTLVVGGSLVNQVVIADQVERLGQGVEDAVHLTERLRDGTGGVELAHTSGNLAGGGNDLNLTAFEEFVAVAPGDDARVIAVAEDEGIDILLPPFIDIFVVVEGILLGTETVERLVDDQQTQVVAGTEELFATRIVRSAYGIEPRGFELTRLAPLGSIERGSADDPVVVVDATAIE